MECSCKACCCAPFSVTRCCQSRLCSSKPPANGASCLLTTSQKMVELFCERNRAAAATSEKACLHRSLQRLLQNSVFCSLASSIASQGCCEVVLRRQKQQTALKKPDKSRIAAQCMVLETVAATSVASQPLRLDYITTKPL